MSHKDTIVQLLHAELEAYLSPQEIGDLLEVPTHSDHGDLAFPCFVLAKSLRKAPQQIAADLAGRLESPALAKVEAVGPYVNFFLARQGLAQEVVGQILEEGSDYGRSDLGQGGRVPIDMSSPNIAKPMSMGHLRSTVIGNAIANILTKLNYQVHKINHLGDWGTQFGKLIVAYKLWGDDQVIQEDPVNELVKLYVRFHEEADLDPALDDQARQAFRQLEAGDPDMLRLWKWFKEESIKEFEAIYDRLNVDFDDYKGESFYNDKMQAVIQDLEESGVSSMGDGAVIVDLEAEGLPPALIQKSDGATLYMTRDLATAFYRKQTYDFDQSLYVVGNEQSNHFKQLKAVLKKMGQDWADDMHHIAFGLITIQGKKLSTRQGKVVLLADVLDEATAIALDQINQKNPNLENKEEVADQVGVGAVVFHDLKNDRLNNFDFNLEEIVQFEGETGPYVQYTYARIQSILAKYPGDLQGDWALEAIDDTSWQIIKLLASYPQVVQRAGVQYEPSVIAKYAIQLAQAFNKYYGHTRILEEDPGLKGRIALISAVAVVLKDSLALLGIQAPQKM